MRKKSLLTAIAIVLAVAFALLCSACSTPDDTPQTLESIRNDYGVVITGGGFTTGSELVSNEITATSTEGQGVLTAIQNQNYDKQAPVRIFDIFVTKNGEKVQPSGKVTVSLPLPDAQIDDLLLFHVKADETVENLTPTYAEGKISFETSSFSYFVIAEKAPAEHQHSYTWVEGKEPSCTEEGIAPHYYCDGCEKYFNANYGEIDSVTLPVEPHDYGSMFWGKSANFWEDGNIEYYQCSECEKYFNENYGEIDSPVIPKYSTNLSICVNGTATALVLGEQHENFIEWSLEGLSVTKGDEITICQTDDTEFTHDYSAEGNVGVDGKILTTATAANVVLTATPNGLMLFIDGYKYEGVVIEINDIQYPMNFVTYPDGETTSYIYGYVNFEVNDEFVIVDNVSGTVYDYDDLAEEFLWDTWDFHCGDDGEFVIDYAARYGIEFDEGGNKKIYINKAFAPLDGSSYELTVENDSVSLEQMEIPKNSEGYEDFMWYVAHEDVVNNEDIVSYVNENGLFAYIVSLPLEEGTKFTIKNLTANSVINAEHLVEVYAENGSLTKDGDFVEILISGYYSIVYLPCYNGFMIEEAENPADVYMYLDGDFIPLLKDENGFVTYDDLTADTSTTVMFTDNTYTTYLPITLDSQTNSSIAQVIEYSGINMLMFNKAGTYNLTYNVETGVLSITSDDEQGGGEDPVIDYLYYLSVSGGSSETQTLSMQANPDNDKEVCYKGVQLTASCFIGVAEIAKDGSTSTSYGALTGDTDSSIAQSYGTAAMIKIAGTYDVYFDTTEKTIRLVSVSGGSCEEGACEYDDGVVTKPPTHTEKGVRTYTCTICGGTKDEPIDKTPGHEFGDWTPDRENDNKHVHECKCGEVETGDCDFNDGEITKEPTHTEEGVKTYTCTICGRTKDEPVDKTPGHEFGDWTPDRENDNKHVHECKCGEVETGDCDFNDGEITKEPTHTEEGVKTYTCTICGRTKDEPVDKTPGHEFGDWTADEVDETKHYRECACGESETGDCDFDPENGTCTVCGREKAEEEGIIIVVAGGNATFKDKETATTYSTKYGENANVYIAQENDVLNVTLTDQVGRTFKHWASASGTIIPDKDFSMLVLISGYYYPVFEDTADSTFSDRVLINKGNCEEGTLYMSTNAKGDIKYELEFVNYGRHAFDEIVEHSAQYHKQVCSICGETIYDTHTEDDYEKEKEPTHTEEGAMKYECFCGHEWTESIPPTDEHSIDYDDWHIVEESKNGQYGKYRVYCKYCDYYEEYWYLGGLDFISFMEGKMINYQYTYGGKVCHDEYYYSYTNAENQKVYIWALQYEYETSSYKDNNDTFIFMYVDDEDPTTIEPIYLSKSKGDSRSEFLWAIYGYAYDVNGWIDVLDSPDLNVGCNDGMLLGNSMSARSSVFESYHSEWAETYNGLRIPTSKDCYDLSGTPWQVYHEGKAFTGGYYDNEDYVTTGGRDIISFVKDPEQSYKKYAHVDKATGITYGYEDYGTDYRTIFIMRKYKTIVSPEEFESLDEASQSVSYSYGNIENDIKSLCAKRNTFSNFTLTVPETINAFRFIFSDPVGCVKLSGADVNVYNNTARVYDSGNPITLTWQGEEGIVFDRYEIWDFAKQEWVVLSEDATYQFNTSDNPVRDAVYARVICHEVDVPVEPGETFRITVENGYFEIDGKEYTGTVEVEGNTLVYVYANEVENKTFDHWLDGNGEVFDDYRFNVTSDITLTPVYVDTVYRVYCQGWEYESLISVDGGEMHYSNEFEGKIGDTFELKTICDPDGECTVFIGWYMEVYSKGGYDYVFISDSQSLTYEIKGNEQGWLYSVWTTGENPMIKKLVDIRVTNGFVSYAGGEGGDMGGGTRDNAYSAISLAQSGMVSFYDDPTDDVACTTWDIAYKYELEGEVQHESADSYEYEDDYYPARYWLNDPQYNYPDGEINVTGSASSNNEEGGGKLEEGGEILLP